MLGKLDPTVRELLEPYVHTGYQLNKNFSPNLVKEKPIFKQDGVSFKLWCVICVTLLTRYDLADLTR